MELAVFVMLDQNSFQILQFVPLVARTWMERLRMRPIDADMLQELYNKRIFDTWNNETASVSWAATYADFKDDIDSIFTIPQPSNEPLTLEELWEMNEEPVWVQNLEEPGKSQWRLLYWDRGKHLVL